MKSCSQNGVFSSPPLIQMINRPLSDLTSMSLYYGRKTCNISHSCCLKLDFGKVAKKKAIFQAPLGLFFTPFQTIKKLLKKALTFHPTLIKGLFRNLPLLQLKWRTSSTSVALSSGRLSQMRFIGMRFKHWMLGIARLQFGNFSSQQLEVRGIVL